MDIDQADLSINPFYLRMTHIQAMSDDGQRMIRTIKSVLAELIAGETYYLQSLHKLLRTHEIGGISPTSNHFVTSSSSAQTSLVGDEGATIVKGWMAVKDQVKLIMEVHQVRLYSMSSDCVFFPHICGCACYLGVPVVARRARVTQP